LKAGIDGSADSSDVDATVISRPEQAQANQRELAPQSEVGPEPEAPLAGTRLRYFGDYELLEEIARGGMGVVYKARQTRLNRIVALKMILAGQFASQADVERFQTEAEAAAQLDHSGIVPIFEVGEHDGHHFYSMALVEGDSLADRIVAGSVSPRDSANLLMNVTEAICSAHAKGVIHRDLKPANILVDCDGQPRVTDFGLAKQAGIESGLTVTGQILGTPSYMSPEQAGGQAGEAREAADVYSLGAILFAMLTGRPPFVGDSPLEVVQAVINDEPASPRILNHMVPRDLEMICLRCLQKRPGDRYASAQELVDDLGRFLNGEPVRARPLPTLTRWYRWADRDIGKFTAAAILVCLLLPIPVNAWLAYLFGRWSWEIVGASYGFMLLISTPYLLMMLITSVRAKHRRRTGDYLNEGPPVSRMLLGIGCVLIAVAVGGYIYLLSNHGWAVPKNARFLALLVIVGIGLVIRGLGIRR
jgi:serine/threonine protein kinase